MTDAKELREAIAKLDAEGTAFRSGDDIQAHVKILRDAALATLPREVERECWEVLLADGCSFGLYRTEQQAKSWASQYPRSQVVHLKGTAILEGKK